MIVRKIFLFCFLSLKNFSQEDNKPYVDPLITNTPYLKYLFIPDSTTQSSVFGLTLQYLYTPEIKSFASKGASGNLILNLSRFFSRKFVLGLCYNFKFYNGVTKQHYSKEFKDDFDKNFITNYNNSVDSAQAYTLKGGIDGSAGFESGGNTKKGWGIVFSPFPQKYGGFMLLLKTGTNWFTFTGPFTNKLFYSDGGRNMNLRLKNSYSIELTFKPYKFFNSEGLKRDRSKPINLLKYIGISLYYERISLGNAVIDQTNHGRDMSIKEVVNQSFISKYRNINNFGIEMGIAIY